MQSKTTARTVGHETALLETLYETYRGRMFRICYSVLGNVPDAEDALHNAFLAISKHLSQFGDDPDDPEIAAYLYRAARNQSLKLLDRRNRRRRAEVPLDEAWIGTTDVTDDMLEALADRMEAERVVQAILALPEPYRSVLHLHFGEELTAAQIAKEQGRRLATVKQQLVRGKKLLMKYLKEGEKGRG